MSELTLETLKAMCLQEQGYMTRDYLHQDSHDFPNGPIDFDVDIDSRQKMAQWCFQVVDFCKFRRETVSIAMNYVDRYLMTRTEALQDRSVFQLLVMASLYTAIKIHEPEAMDPKLVSSLSRGAFSADDIEGMEAKLLFALDWKVNPPTPLSFVQQFLDLVPESLLEGYIRDTVYDVTKHQIELAVSEFAFIAVKPSTIAFVSLMNALESLQLDLSVLDFIGKNLSQAIDFNRGEAHVSQARQWLYKTVEDSLAEFSATPTPAPTKPIARRASIDVSPRSVARTEC